MTARTGLSTPTWMPDFAPQGVTLACREPDVDPEVFFPLPADTGDEARAICRRCPVVESCADWATWNLVADGIWGALSPEQRAARRRAWELTS